MPIAINGNGTITGVSSTSITTLSATNFSVTNGVTFSDATTQTTAITSAVSLGFVAAASGGAIGTYVGGQYNGGSGAITLGSVIPGSQINVIGSSGGANVTQSGTWRFLGILNGGFSNWCRVS